MIASKANISRMKCWFFHEGIFAHFHWLKPLLHITSGYLLKLFGSQINGMSTSHVIIVNIMTIASEFHYRYNANLFLQNKNKNILTSFGLNKYLTTSCSTFFFALLNLEPSCVPSQNMQTKCYQDARTEWETSPALKIR